MRYVLITGAIIMGSVFMQLQAEINRHELFMELIHEFDLDALTRAPDCGAPGPRAAAAALIPTSV